MWLFKKKKQHVHQLAHHEKISIEEHRLPGGYKDDDHGAMITREGVCIGCKCFIRLERFIPDINLYYFIKRKESELRGASLLLEQLKKKVKK